MNLIKCENNHFYNKDKFNSCPQCSYATKNPYFSDIMGEQQEDILTVQPNNNNTANIKHIVGWIIVTSGTMNNTSFQIYEGSNYIGYNDNMDISLSPDSSILKRLLATITYYSADATFSIKSNDDDCPIYLNDSSLQTLKPLSSHDKIVFEDSTLYFVPFCGEVFRW